jgi:hypothetical protein
MLKGMLSVPLADREHSQWQFGYPVPLVDKPRPAALKPSSGAGSMQSSRTP